MKLQIRRSQEIYLCRGGEERENCKFSTFFYRDFNNYSRVSIDICNNERNKFKPLRERERVC